ncbi:ribonuclease R family protein [Simkania sp.]|uniref:ribonuclease R family protein n=1 Tax=Simkania sp. TaxID=34094 RepID=UPI003B51E18B
MTKPKPRKTASPHHPVIQGTIHIHSKGFGFVTPSDPENFPEDVFIPKHLKKNAIDGDLVEIAINSDKKSEKGPEGYVLSITKRAKEQLVGIVWIINPKGNYVLYVQSLGEAKSAFVHKKNGISYKIGDRLLLNVLDWGDENALVLCEVTEKIGTIYDTESDIPAAVKDFGIRSEFPKPLLQLVKKLPKKVPKEDLKGRLDLTTLETFTIDPTTAKDFDDALSLSKDEKGYHLAIHIADVSHYVKEGSPLDEEAKLRSNSTYFPGECIPMLPEALSNHLCSLKEKELRLTISVLVDFDLEGNQLRSKIEKAYIYSQKRFTYEEAKEVLDGKRKSPYLPTLQLMEELCLLLKKKRSERGSVDLALPEVVIQVDKKGKPYGYEVVEYDITHQLVEEFMLKANEIVAEYFVKRSESAVFRIHEVPSQENLEEFYALARSLGFPLKAKPTQEDVQKLFTLAKQTPHIQRLSVAFIRSMKLAVYSHQNVGHYGLALENYCHFTSPIRRYSDLVIHRLLFDKTPPPNLEEISRTCSERERTSFKAEVSVVLMKKLRLLAAYQKEDPSRIYKGVLSKIKPFGFFFEVEPLQLEGFIHLSDLRDDYYEFNQKVQALIGQNTGKSFKMGDPLEIVLSEIDLITLECKWILLQDASKQPKSKNKKFYRKRTSKKKTSRKSRKKS